MILFGIAMILASQSGAEITGLIIAFGGLLIAFFGVIKPEKNNEKQKNDK